MLDLRELLNIPYVETEMGFGLSPNGGKVAFSWNSTGRWEIFENRLGDIATPQQITSGPGNKYHPRYSPDGRMLAYSVDLDGSEHYHIRLLDLTTRKDIDLTPGITYSLQAFFAWSPDGNYLAFISDQTGQFNVFMMDVEKGQESFSNARLVLDAGYPAWKVHWSPDGNWLAIVVEAGGLDYGVFIVPVSEGPTKRIADITGPIDAGQVSWSPDSQRLAFVSDSEGYNNIGIFELSTSKIQWLPSGKEEKQTPCWSPDGKEIAYIVSEGTVSYLAVSGVGATPRLFSIEKGTYYSPQYSSDGESIIVAFDSPCHPTDLWRFSIVSEIFTQLTNSLTSESSRAAYVMPEEITYPGMDGTPVPALLFNGREGRNCPAVIIIHGGPDWLFQMTWYPIMAYLAGKGWIVLAPNYRGSTGYGRQWQQASRFDFGGVDTDDVAAGALYLMQQGLADPKRIGVTGRSHGGYLTASCLTRYPELWTAGSAVVPFLDWFTNHAEIREDLRMWDLENFGDPVKDHDLWQERSPSYHLEKISAPMQLICARLDVRCPAKDSEKAFAEMKQMGKEVELIIYEDEGHVFLKKENILDSEVRRMTFLERYLR